MLIFWTNTTATWSCVLCSKSCYAKTTCCICGIITYSSISQLNWKQAYTWPQPTFFISAVRVTLAGELTAIGCAQHLSRCAQHALGSDYFVTMKQNTAESHWRFCLTKVSKLATGSVFTHKKYVIFPCILFLSSEIFLVQLVFCVLN